MTEALQLVSALARRVGSAPPAEPLVVRMCRAVVELLGADGGTVTCAPAEDLRCTVCATDRLAARLDELEETCGDGPGLRAFRERRFVGTLIGSGTRARAVAGQHGAAAFPLYGAVAAGTPEVRAAGALRVAAWPVRSGGVPVAVLTLYARGAGRRGPGVADGQVLADALAGATEGAPRVGVHRAVGVLVAQTGLPPADALALLRARAFASGRGVPEIAEEVLLGRLRFDGRPPRGT